MVFIHCIHLVNINAIFQHKDSEEFFNPCLNIMQPFVPLKNSDQNVRILQNSEEF